MTVSIDFSGKVALVTGAAQGIGLATARSFAEAGASVMLADLREDVAQAAVDIEAAGGKVAHCTVDVADPASCAAMIAATTGAFGRLDFAFNNAGVGSYERPVAEVPDADWERVIGVNLSGVFYCIKHQVPAMMMSGGGVIVNNSSLLGTRALPGTSIEYTAAKHGVIGLTRQVAVNHGADGIRCLAVCPGLVETVLVTEDKRSGAIDDAAKQAIVSRTPLGRLGETEDIGQAVLALCSPLCGFVNGTEILVDGGLRQG